MSNNIFSPLSSKVAVESKGIKLESVSFVGKINLRIKDEDSESRKIVSEFLKYNLPISSGEVQGNNETRTAWLGPNEFLIHCSDNEKYNIINKISDILSNRFYSLTNVQFNNVFS